jgi:D-alanyl-D-alanine carboxypeptidase
MLGRKSAKSRGATLRAARFVFVPSLAVALGLCANPAAASIRHHHAGRVVLGGGMTDPDKDAALILDGATGKVLYSRNADATRHPASLTKMMTLYLLFEQLKNGQMTLATPLPVSEHAAIQHRTKLYLRPGTTIPVEQAIRAIVVCSANDVAVAISEAIGGSEDHFAELMTAKARSLGMSHTFYHNASGLPDDLQVTTASDLSILARHLAYDFPQYFPYFSTQTFVWHGEMHQTTDHLIGAYDGADGIKTGYTQASGFNLVSSVVRGGAHVIAVVMGGRTARRRDEEMMHLLDGEFAQINQNPTLVARANVPWQTIAQNSQATPVIAGFQIAAAGLPPKAPVEQITTSATPANAPMDPDDEAAAESRADPDELPPTATAQPATSIAQAPLPHIAAPPPVPVRTASLPPSTTSVAGVSQIVKAQVARTQAPTPQPIPRPQSPIVLAAYNPHSLPAITPRSKPAAPGENTANLGSLGIQHSAQTAQNVHDWTIQIGAYGDAVSAKAQLTAYAERSMDVLGQSSRIVIPFQSVDGHTMFRARFGPFAEREAREVCERLTERGQTCFAVLTEH